MLPVAAYTTKLDKLSYGNYPVAKIKSLYVVVP